MDRRGSGDAQAGSTAATDPAQSAAEPAAPTVASLMDAFFGENVYRDFPLADYEPDLQGWGGHDFLLKVIDELQPKTIVEVGVWKGRSAIAMAKRLKAQGSGGVVICIDTWLGAQEHFQEKFRGDLRRRNGYPHLYDQFIANVLHEGVEDVVLPLPLASLAAAQLLARRKLVADMIHIDAGHGYLEVKSDIAAYWPLLSGDGVAIFDDYGGWQGVTRAVNEFAAKTALPLIGTHGKALLSPSRKVRFRTKLATIDKGAWAPKGS